MRPLIAILSVAYFFPGAIAAAQIPAPLQKLDVDASSFPTKLGDFLASPEAASLSARDAFYLLGASHTIHPPGANGPEFRQSHANEQLQERIRAFAWSKGRATRIPPIAALAEEWKRRRNQDGAAVDPRGAFNAFRAQMGKTPEDRAAQEKLKHKAVLSYAASIGAVLDYAASEAEEWAQLAELEAQVAKLAASTPRVDFPDPPALKPDLLRGVPANLAGAMHSFSRAVLPCLSRHPSVRPGVTADDLTGREDARWIQTRLALTGGIAPAKHDDDERRKRMSVLCGTTGWPTLPSLIQIPPLTRMLENREWTQAVGYAFLFEFHGNSRQGAARASELARALIIALVPDWERAALGREVVEGAIARQVEGYTMPGGFFEWLPYASDREALRATLDWIQWAATLPISVRYRATHLAVIELLDARPTVDGKLERRSVRPRPIPQEVREQAVALYAAPLKPTGSVDHIVFAIGVLSLVDSNVTRGRLREFLQHPSATVANRAAQALRAFGETIADRPPEKPLLVRFTIDGASAAKQQFSWSRRYRDRNSDAQSDYASGLTDEKGRLEIPRDFFHGVVAVPHPSQLVFMGHERAGHLPPIEGDLTVTHVIPWPSSFEEPLKFSAKTVRPVLRISEAPGYALKQPAKLEICVRSPRVADTVRLPVQYRKDPTALGEVQLPRMQAGKWEITVRAHNPPGIWHRVVDFTPEQSSANAELNPATRIEIDPWENRPEFSWYSTLELFRGAEFLEPMWDTSGSGKIRLLPLPAGTYRLRLPSSAELKDKLHYDVVPADAAFEAEEKHFTINASTGPLLNIGAFEPKPVMHRAK